MNNIQNMAQGFAVVLSAMAILSGGGSLMSQAVADRPKPFAVLMGAVCLIAGIIVLAALAGA